MREWVLALSPIAFAAYFVRYPDQLVSLMATILRHY